MNYFHRVDRTRPVWGNPAFCWCLHQTGTSAMLKGSGFFDLEDPRAGYSSLVSMRMGKPMGALLRQASSAMLNSS